jgi:hypothetical protein
MADDGPVRLQPVDLASVEKEPDHAVLAPDLHLVPLACGLLGVGRRSEVWRGAVVNDVTLRWRSSDD